MTILSSKYVKWNKGGSPYRTWISCSIFASCWWNVDGVGGWDIGRHRTQYHIKTWSKMVNRGLPNLGWPRILQGKKRTQLLATQGLCTEKVGNVQFRNKTPNSTLPLNNQRIFESRASATPHPSRKIQKSPRTLRKALTTHQIVLKT